MPVRCVCYSHINIFTCVFCFVCKIIDTFWGIQKFLEELFQYKTATSVPNQPCFLLLKSNYNQSSYRKHLFYIVVITGPCILFSCHRPVLRVVSMWSTMSSTTSSDGLSCNIAKLTKRLKNDFD